LGDYQLALNPRKTGIRELPLPLEAAWTEDLRKFSFRSGRRRGLSDIIAYFDFAFRHKRSYPAESVLRYALGRIRRLRVHPSNWPILEDLLLQSLATEPGIIDYALEQLVSHERQGLPVQKARWEDLMNQLILRHSRIGHGSEVAWSLQTCIAFDLPVHREPAEALSRTDDSFVALMALDAHSRGLAPTLDLSAWALLMDTENLYTEHWLLAYEANIKGWLPSVTSTDHVMADNRFGFLKSNGIEFYELARATQLVPTGISPSLGVVPFFVLPGEGYGDGAEPRDADDGQGE